MPQRRATRYGSYGSSPTRRALQRARRSGGDLHPGSRATRPVATGQAPATHRQTKTDASSAVLPLPDICVAALQLREKQRDEDGAAAGDAWDDSDLVFTTRYGIPVDPRNFNRAWDGRIARAGLPRITVHDARRSCASMLAVLDVHPREAMEILRHAESAITMEICTVVSSHESREAL